MDFFARQDRARRNTAALVFYFAAAVAIIVVAVYFAFVFLFNRGVLWNPSLCLWVSVGTLGVIVGGCLFKVAQLSSGGAAVASMLGGQPVNPHTLDPGERKLLNIVEEISIASGVPVPEVFILRGERGINAFAAGFAQGDAVVAVTDGAVRLLNRDELQGVIAHEFSHIINGDMRLNVRLIGFIFGIMCLAIIGRFMLRSRSRGRGGGQVKLLGLALLLIGWIGVFFGRLMQSAVSRQREYLADASAVQFTRNPQGLAGALKKIGALDEGSRLESPHAEEAGHLFFSGGISSVMFSSHPPLVKRIRALDPSFDGDFKRVRFNRVSAEAGPGDAAVPAHAGRPVPVNARAAPLSAPAFVLAGAVMPQVGKPGAAQLRYANVLRSSIPHRLHVAARDALSAQALVFALLLAEDDDARAGQTQLVADQVGAPVAAEMRKLAPDVSAVAAHARLPLLELAMPGLRMMSQAQFSRFSGALKAVVEFDTQIELFEYVLQKMVVRHLEPHFTVARKPVVQFYSSKPLAQDAMVLLSALAWIGSDNVTNAGRAFARGAALFARASDLPLEFLPEAQCGLDRVDAALDRFAQAVPQIRKNILGACAEAVAADGVIQECEAELIRAIADAMDCPLPPFVSG